MASESGLSSQVRSLRQPQGGRITSEGQYGKDIDWISRYPPDDLKIISLTLEKLLLNLPRLGDYTQRVRPGAHPVLYQAPKDFIQVPQSLTQSSGARGLDGGRSMYLPTEWGPQT